MIRLGARKEGIFAYSEQILCDMAGKRGSINPALILLHCSLEMKQDPQKKSVEKGKLLYPPSLIFFFPLTGMFILTVN